VEQLFPLESLKHTSIEPFKKKLTELDAKAERLFHPLQN
jgi:hypothetical protein